MIQFNEARMTPDTKHIIVDVSIVNMSYYENVYVDAVILKYIDKDGNEQPVPDGEFSRDNGRIGENVKRFRVYADIDSISYNLFIIHAYCTDGASPDTPCGMTATESTKAIYNTCPIYQNLMAGLRNLGDDCSPPQALMNQFFRYKAFQLAIETGDYDAAAKYWNQFFSRKSKKTSKGCGCHGR